MIVDHYGRELRVGQRVTFNAEAILGPDSKVIEGEVTEVQEVVLDAPPNVPPMKVLEVTTKYRIVVAAGNGSPRIKGLWVALQPAPEKEHLVV